MSTTIPTIESTIFDGNNDLMILTNKNIVSKISNADDLPLCSVASYSIVEYLSSETSVAIERIDDISAAYFKLSNALTSNISAVSSILSTTLDNKIQIDGTPINDNHLNIEHIALSDYHNLVTLDGGILSNTLYIVSSDTLNMYDEKIQNLANGESEFDAINLGQLNVAKTNLENAITTVSNELSNETNRAQLIENAISTNLTVEIDRASAKDIELQNSINSISTNIDNKIWIDGNNTTNLSLCHISQEDYYDTVLTATDEEISNVLFIISGDNHNAFGKRITNLYCNPDELSDAATVEYVNSKISTESNLKTKEFAEMLYDSLSSNGISAGANFDDLDAQHALSVLLSLANTLNDYLKA